MRKFQIWAFCLMAAFFLTNCGGGDAAGESGASTSKITLETGKKATDGDFSFEMLSLKQTKAFRPDGTQPEGLGAEIVFNNGDGGWQVTLFEEEEEGVYSAARVGDRDVSYVLGDFNEEKQTISLTKKVGEPVE